jgi:hypothetical protein
VEFALVGGLFFFLVFSLVNAGFLLYSRAAVQNAADVGTATLAAEGRCMTGDAGICATPPAPCAQNADAVAICRMDTAGLTSTPLIKVTEIDIWRIEQNPDGSPVDDCDSTGMVTGGSLPCNDLGGDAGSPCAGYQCVNEYSPQGVLLNPISSKPPWPVINRNVTSTNADFARLVIKYKYSLIANAGVLYFSTSNVFRLEPQVLAS